MVIIAFVGAIGFASIATGSYWVGQEITPEFEEELSGSDIHVEIEPQTLAWCDDHDGELVLVGEDDEPYCVMPTGDSVRLMDRVEVAD